MRPLLTLPLLAACALAAGAAGAQEFVNARLVAEHSGKCLSVVGQSSVSRRPTVPP